MHLYLFLIVVVSLSCGSLPPADVDLTRAASATFGIIMAWALLCHVGARLCAIQVRQEAIDPLVGADMLEKQLAAFRWLGLGVVVLCLAGFGLARCLEELPIVGSSVTLQALILLAPGLAILWSTWSAEHLYGVLLGYTDSGAKNYFQSVGSLARANVAWLLAPVMILLGVNDLIGMLPIEENTANVVTAAIVLLFVPLGLPWLIRHLFKTGPLDPTSQQWITELLEAAGLQRTRIARWETGGRAFNAMVVGFVPPLRTLLISDRLLDELPRHQVAMVVLHEAAHLKRRHVPIRMMAIIPAWGAAVLVSKLAGESDWALAGGSVVGILMTMLVLRLTAYRTEYDADVQACRLAASISDRVENVPANYELASDALATALMRVTFDHPSSRKATWLHPGVADRVDWMRRQRKAPNTSSARAGTVANPA